jgi:hypothetical protein
MRVPGLPPLVGRDGVLADLDAVLTSARASRVRSSC